MDIRRRAFRQVTRRLGRRLARSITAPGRCGQAISLAALLLPGATLLAAELPAAPALPAAAPAAAAQPAATLAAEAPTAAESPDDIPLIEGPAADQPEDAAPQTAAPDNGEEAADAIPVPPAAPRIASGPDYESCLDRLTNDPAGAAGFADAWAGRGGGIGAAHCHALAEIALGHAAEGAAVLDRLAGESAAAGAARATIFGQADQAWMLAGQPGRAVISATAALALTPDDTDALIDRAAAYAGLQSYHDAVADLDQALEIEPSRTDAMIARAGDYRRLDDLDEAEQDVDRALARDPENADALLERGIVRQRRGNLAGARADWEQASGLAPDDATGDLARQNLALLEAGPQR